MIKRYIKNYHSYQRTKTFYNNRNNLLKPLFIFIQRWVDLSMNFVIDFFELNNNNIICTIVNCLLKERYYAFYKATKKNIAVKACVKILFHYVFKIHESPSN